MFNTALFDKRSVFPFSIVCIRYRDSNLPVVLLPLKIALKKELNYQTLQLSPGCCGYDMTSLQWAISFLI